MYNLLVKLMVITALMQLGISATNSLEVEKASRKVLQIDWKPISLFPEEAKRFR